MDEHAWLLVSFLIFVFLTYKHIIKAMSGIIKNANIIISDKIKEAENIYLEAKEKHDEAKKLFAQLEITKKYIHANEEREIQFDLDSRKKDFKEALLVKETQLENQINRDIRNFKNDTLNILNEKLKEKFVYYLQKDSAASEFYTNLMIERVKDK